MRILLASNASYAPPRGGSTRSNLVWLRSLTQHGHVCRVLSASDGADFETVVDAIQIRGVRDLPRRPSILGAEIQTFQPDFVLVSSEDISQVLLREAGRVAAGRIVYLAHTPQFFPFGPESWNRDTQAADVVRRARMVVVIGGHMAAYIEQHLGVRATVIHPPMYGTPPYPQFGAFEDGWVLMVNPCQVKGMSIFLELARRFPQLPFAALAGWGTTSADRGALASLPNVSLLESVPDIDDVLARTRVLLVPSLWYEGFGLIAMEAMLRGIPVISSDSGGLLEAKHGTGYVIPVR
ncbi:MAG: glycosyltransferase family 4 protein, partial [Acidobacteriaceae bacterium]|nr:glycosyltransferase family 4 protein [Acidobacteriaceae bacterium]